jgi:hypothetical protein
MKNVHPQDTLPKCNVEKSMRIAQMVIQIVPSIRLTEVNELSQSVRGSSGFGSSVNEFSLVVVSEKLISRIIRLEIKIVFQIRKFFRYFSGSPSDLLLSKIFLY